MYSGFIKDLVATYDTVVQYQLVLTTETIALNGLIGQQLKIEHTGEKACALCGRPNQKKLFANGFCYPCFRDRPEADLCIVKPHECHYETCRDQAWGDANCMIPTYVYLAKSSDIKVGVSRALPRRWLNQGAVEAVPLALVPTRKMAGELEVALAEHLPDKTNWRRMLKGEVTDESLSEVRERVVELVPRAFQEYLLEPSEPTQIAYPLEAAPEKITSHNLDKGLAEGTLLGIKGRYLIFDTGVLNLANYFGYEVTID